MKIGIFGGSFNPAHVGHLRALEAFCNTLELDRVYVLPSFVPPHKQMPSLWADFEDRLNMAKVCFKKAKLKTCEVVFSDLEKRLYEETGEKSYTKLTLERLMSENQGEFYLFVGTDMFVTLHSWMMPEFIFKNAVISVMSRDGDKEIIEKFKKRYEKEFSARIEVIREPHLPASSTKVREDIKNHLVSDLITKEVKDYIEKNSLYRELPAREELLNIVKGEIKESRFIHTLSVEKEALFLGNMLCPHFSDDLSKAAILHDVTKSWSFEKQVDYLKENGVDLSEEDLKSPNTLHALSGSIFAKNLGAKKSVCSIIEKHTTADADMSLMEKIVYISDFIEENRKFESCKEERRLLHNALSGEKSYKKRLALLDDSLLRILERTVVILNREGVFIHPRTLRALDFYKSYKTKE